MTFLYFWTMCIQVFLVLSRVNPTLPDSNVTLTICLSAPIPMVLDNMMTSGGLGLQGNLKYSLEGKHAGLLFIDESSGVIQVRNSSFNDNLTEITFDKVATDGLGHTGRVAVKINVVKAVTMLFECPSRLSLRVNETTPVGEEIIQVTFCRVGGDPVTPIPNIQQRVHINTKDCRNNWTYSLSENTALVGNPFKSMSGVTINECQDACSFVRHLVCNSATYNFVSRTCLLYNETEFTVPNIVRKRMGIFMYRKTCEQETKAKIRIRAIFEGVKSKTHLFIKEGISILTKLLKMLRHPETLTLADVNMVNRIHSLVVLTTGLVDATTPDIQIYIHKNGLLLDIEVAAFSVFNETNQDFFIGLLEMFDSFVKSLGNIQRCADFEYDSAVTNLKVVILTHTRNNNTDAVISTFDKQMLTAKGSVAIGSGVLNSNNGNAKRNKTVIAIGALNLNSFTTGTVSAGVDNKVNISYTFGGHLLAVVTRPVLLGHFVEPVHLDIPTATVSGEIASRLCSFYIPGSRSPDVWGSDGCTVAGYNKTHTRCQCTHLTSFAVLMQIKPFQPPGIHAVTLDVLTVIGCCISIAALSTTVAVLLWFRLRTERYILLINLSVAVILAQAVFIAGIDAVKYKLICRLVAILLHYLYLSVFTLMLAEGIHLYHKLHRAFQVAHSFNMLLALGWGAPLIIVIMSLATDADGYSTVRNCWLSTDGAIWAFVGPALTVIMVNAAILVSVMRTFLSVTFVAKKTDRQKFKASVRATFVLLPLLGITWLFGVVAVSSDTLIFQYMFAVFNSLQGFFIFVFHVVCNDDIRRAVEKYRGISSYPVTPEVSFDNVN